MPERGGKKPLVREHGRTGRPLRQKVYRDSSCIGEGGLAGEHRGGGSDVWISVRVAVNWG